MKIYALLLASAVMSTTICFAQSKDEKNVATQVESLKKALVDGDRASLEKLTDDKLSYGHSNGRIEDKATFVSNLVTGKSDFVTIDLTDQKIAIAGNTAIVRHTLSADINDNGVAGHVKLYVLLVWSKEDGQWKLLARQAVKVPA
ncbi:nuclear transport factor 2 family protein [Chitinophaga agri]|uniref:Nuclear transport factor 2 family protein n=1 Tax=Chitinophaga agri TaxID=2703787 RepID=A0A6B9Z9H3_9BACT|nr:nuclear transport factor 2 family protein [Chitinophaga agri]QHS58636.1 nuclear transport factor 2 family protein [Chitinophaga agri]